ncbi:MAG: hypothetical protein ACREHF_00040 [Rhizomicrobium sp.]
MNKYLAMSAAALLGSTLPAAAGQLSQAHRIHFATSNGGSYCDGMLFYKSPYAGANIALGSHLYSGCGSTNAPVAGKMHASKVVLVENWQGEPPVLLYDISKPIRNGGTWSSWACYSGTSCSELNSGTYKLGYTAQRVGRASTTARLSEIIAARKAAAQ